MSNEFKIVNIAAVNFPFEGEVTILAAAMASPDEIIILISNGEVFRYYLSRNEAEYAFSIPGDIKYQDGGFDLKDKCSIYTLGSIIVVVNDFKQHGYLHYPGIQHCLHLWREDYHADISCFPIALFKDEQGVPHLIHGVAWNQVHITNLNSGRILTVKKSLVAERDEKNHFYLAKYIKTAHPFGPGLMTIFTENFIYRLIANTS